jgi:hypothetical protein
VWLAAFPRNPSCNLSFQFSLKVCLIILFVRDKRLILGTYLQEICTWLRLIIKDQKITHNKPCHVDSDRRNLIVVQGREKKSAAYVQLIRYGRQSKIRQRIDPNNARYHGPANKSRYLAIKFVQCGKNQHWQRGEVTATPRQLLILSLVQHARSS